MLPVATGVESKTLPADYPVWNFARPGYAVGGVYGGSKRGDRLPAVPLPERSPDAAGLDVASG